ncbi:aminotransferase class III-fold pyridoxal phosphate-dependent enzyme [Actinoplanes xinjiangensis]|uniref:4-aminobutyrate aminotransferase-like enzyme n=1 Tax=Actinoplanes xinjiangensis TaxID=512350 RepID=A0A316EXK9_9ACTN|nr:aminotransferase class III-fold pyridoxal phosphate-dependent enzyme [Actinoplanes xinjiangensis]PWK36089.1 4-aminobutyrate aminotransferase-like enzyme [Actinoplanes xinjiangensis]GIF42907.1 4-aminobutyrate transaminase [Actinoplanes xinjiangensis]
MTGSAVLTDRVRCLSALDESAVLPGRYELLDADNATLRLRDMAGRERECTDLMSAYASVNFGHRNPFIEQALRRSSDLAALFHVPEAEQVAAWLCGRLGRATDRRVLYQVGGSFAVSTALALARRHRPGRVLAIEGAFHGLGVDAAAVTTVQREFSLQDTGLPALVAGEVRHLRVGEVPRDWTGVSCLIFEPVQGANGYVPLPADWLHELVMTARAAGVVTIADEIQCGFYRHGTLSPSTAAGLDADITLYGKSLTNGMYPLSAVVYRRFLEERATAPVYLAHTFQTATLGPVAAAQVCRYIDENDVGAMAGAVETQLSRLAEHLTSHGLARRVYLTGPALSFEPLGVSSRDIVRRAFDDGVLVFAGGSHGERIRIAPPLTTPAAQLAAAITTIRSALPG